MAALLLAAVALIAATLIVVVVGIRQEPSTTELRTHPPTRIAAITRRLLGVSVRRPDPQPTDEYHAPESCLATWPGKR
jgi:hypothetical protein